MSRWFTFWQRYLTGNAPWDTGVTPPEITRLIEEEGLPPGRALDVGCGTGTNLIYLARHGWEGVGVDFVGRAIRLARRKARRAGVSDRTRFLVGDVRRLGKLDLRGPFDLAMDIGCAHSLPRPALLDYAATLARLVRPGGTYMLYAFRPRPGRPGGIEPDELDAIFAPHFRTVWNSLGKDASADVPSAWYRLERVSIA
ncbi:MAG: hypothetical protein Kow00124_05370 [Anaerolineae bacterium]